MQLDLRDLYDLETVIAESLLIESSDPQVAAWVTGTAGGFDWSRSGKRSTGTLTLEVQLLVPQSIHDRLEEQLSEYYDFDPDEPSVYDKDRNPIGVFKDPDDFIRASLEPGARGELIREWCRNYSIHNSPLSIGLCPSMTETQFIQWVNEWRSEGYSTEGSWLGGGQRHAIHDEECPWCVARMKKGIATGSPDVPAPPLAPDTRRKLKSSRFGMYGRACGEPVRPASFRTKDIGIEGGSVEIRGKKESKLWYSNRFKDVAQVLMKKYRRVIVEAIQDRLGIPEDSPLHRLVFGEQKGKSIPSNMKIYLSDGRSNGSSSGNGQYMSQGYGKVQDLQAVLYNSYSPDAPGPNFTQYLTDKKTGEEAKERVSYVDLNQLETHLAYHYLVDLYLDQSVTVQPRQAPPKEPDEENPWGDFDLSGFGYADDEEPKFETFMGRLAQAVENAIPEQAEEYGYWVDNTGQVFTIMKIPTGLEGLQFLVDPFLPMKPYELEELKEANPDHYNKMKLLPSFSPAWTMGGRDNQVMLETLAEYFADFGITLAPYHQFKPYPIGPDGSIYYIKEDDLIIVNGKSVVGQIIDKDEDGNLIVEQLTVKKARPGEGEDIAFQDVTRSQKKRNYQISRELIDIPAEDVDSLGKVTLENRTYLDLSSAVTKSSKVEKQIADQLEGLSVTVPGEQYIEKLKERYGEKFVDEMGIIDPDNPGEVYEWTDPKLWSKELVTQLSTPREYVDQGGKFFVRAADEDGEEYWERSEPGHTYNFAIIEDRSHPMTPYVQDSKGKYIHALDDPEFQYELKLRGMEWNPLTRQWEATAQIPFYDARGVKKTKRVRFNEALFWMYQTGRQHDKMLEGFARPSAVTGENVKTLLDRKDPHEVQLGIERWTKEWYTFNNRRIKKSPRLFPSPYNMPNPPEEYWDQVTELKLPIPPNAEHGTGRKQYWPCREGGPGGCEGCSYCEQDYVPDNYYVNQGGLDPNNSLMVRFSDGSFKTRDLWTGLEWLAYLVALRRWNNDLGANDESKISKARMRQIQSDFYKGYDLFCLQHKIKREKGKPVDLSGLTELDKLMLIANWQGGLPKTFDIKLTDDYITGMRAIYTDLFYRAMPNEYTDIMVNTVKPEQLRFRPDLLIDDVSFLEEYADKTAHMATLSAEELRLKGEALARRRARRQAKVESESPDDLKKKMGEPEDTFEVDRSQDPKPVPFDPDEHTVEARIEDVDDPDEDEDPTEIEDGVDPNELKNELMDQEAEIDPDTGELIYHDREGPPRIDDDELPWYHRTGEDDPFGSEEDEDEAAAWIAQAERERKEQAHAAEIEQQQQRDAEQQPQTSSDDPEDKFTNLQDIDMPGGDFVDDYDDPMGMGMDF